MGKTKNMTQQQKTIWIVAVIIIAIIAVVAYFSLKGTTIVGPGGLPGTKPPAGDGRGLLPGIGPNGERPGDAGVKDENKAYYTDFDAKECTGKETKLDETFFIEFTAQNLYISVFAMKFAATQNMAEWAAKIKTFKAGVPTFCINDQKAEDYTNSIIESQRYEELMPKIEARIKELEQKFGKIPTE